MTKEKMLEDIRKACVANDPSILDLKFGLRIYHKKRGFGTIIDTTHLKFDEEKDVIYAPFIADNCEVLGRPITLQDILLAIHKKTDSILGKEEKQMITMYDLTKTPQDQEIKTIQFIHSLICV